MSTVSGLPTMKYTLYGCVYLGEGGREVCNGLVGCVGEWKVAADGASISEEATCICSAIGIDNLLMCMFCVCVCVCYT